MSIASASINMRVPAGFRNLLEGLAREVLREQPTDVVAFAAQYFQKLLEQREGEWPCPAPTPTLPSPAPRCIACPACSVCPSPGGSRQHAQLRITVILSQNAWRGAEGEPVPITLMNWDTSPETQPQHSPQIPHFPLSNPKPKKTPLVLPWLLPFSRGWMLHFHPTPVVLF
uniref:Uncharacterized protein n=1 Tax=Corvus moneduloides TaxID=1196302 RepID=A0A8C3ECJ0_CORMO